MAAQQNGASNDFTVKAGLAQMLKGGVIMDVVNAEQVCAQLMKKRSARLAILTTILPAGPHC
ncbi:Pyridoxal 5'-phosphate synthase subunit snz1 [Aspergillus melleus]|uniref:Pyridoxal 5'-phosphate synthase subunit snz1 n=1 Tax=Aspergillus melleus TaxID=138277 RepID=UPI001E8CB46E|nr:Pyridoxal 5'-phosphate synthase subunit snz1 [Aspergillus melleus]KAH8433132.1 Pyridoxal 5'-phosphate synthase subunit snz1 [Aspergillus melleus]